MSISFKCLGPPDGDNALYVVIHTGQSQHPLLFDCGEGCASALKKSELLAVEHLCFSHFHMDHISGFDTFFRCNFNRQESPVNVWGPDQTIEVMHHRFLGFTWNLHEGQAGEWRIHEILKDQVRAADFYTNEAFAVPHSEKKGARFPIIDHPGYRVDARLLSHGSIPSVAYKVSESERSNVDVEKLRSLGYQPGPWLKAVTSKSVPDSDEVEVGGQTRRVGELRDQLLITSSGKSLAYLTDFCLTDSERPEIVEWLRGTDILICEAQYRHADLKLAQANFHSTTRQAGELARDSNVGKLILQHVSRRYSSEEWLEMLSEAQAVFPNTCFPAHWNLTV